MKLLKTVDKATRRYYWTVFLLPMGVLLLMYATRLVFPFGKNSLLVLDLNAQYIAYYEAFRDAFWGEGSLIYNWSRTLGGENFGIMAYYTGSPFMLIYVLFPKKLITEALLTTALLRTGFAALAFAWYLKKSRGASGIRVIIFSTLYALMAYMVIHQMNPMWLDAVIGLPLVMLGVERLLTEGRFLLYTASLSAVFISNFYIGYMVAIFTAVYFFYVYFLKCHGKEGKIARFWPQLFKFAAFSLLSAVIAAGMLVPAYFSLTLGKTEFSDPSFALRSKFALFDALPKFLFGAYDTVRPEGLPTLSIGMMPLLLLPLYFVNRRIPVKEKIMAGVVIFFLFISMTMSTMDLVWHGFQNPNWLNYRYSFILCGFLLILAFDAFNNVEGGYTAGNVGAAGMGLLAFILLVEKTGYEYIDTRITIWSSILWVLVYFGFLAYDAQKGGRNNHTALIVLTGVICAELYIGGFTNLMFVDHDVVFTSRKTYRDFIDGTLPAARKLQAMDKGFYRTEKTYTRTVNDAMAFGFKGISHSSSTLNADAIAYVGKLGYSTAGHWSQYRFSVPSIDAIVGIKYVLTKNENTFGMNPVFEENGIYVLENPLVFPIVYPVSNQYYTFLKEKEEEELPPGQVSNPFDDQNRMLSAMIGSDEVISFYTPIPTPQIEYLNVNTKQYGQGYTKYFPETEGNSHIEFKLQGMGNKELYVAFPSAYPRKVNLWLRTKNPKAEEPVGENEKPPSSTTDQFHGAYFDGSNGNIVPLGQYAEGEEFSLLMGIPSKESGGSGEVFLRDMLFYTFDKELFLEKTAELRHSVSKIELVRATKIEMDVTVKDDQSMFASIPYERGWRVKANGQSIPVTRTDDGLIGFTLPAGEYHVTLTFMPDYFIISMTLSFLGTALLVLLVVVRRYMTKHKLTRVSALLSTMRSKGKNAVVAPLESEN
jgi:uncharacterized membrane protein YfhO